jgi:hypothetical protein
VDPSDFWHVAIAPGETKILTLEQLDDLFRLDIIDAATRVWQPGMSEWLPLSVVAGLEAEPAAKPAPPPPPSSRAPARPPAPPIRTAQPVARIPTVTSWPSPVQPAAMSNASAWPGVASAPSAPVESVRPMVVTHRPMPVQSGGGSGGRFVLALAFVAGIGVTLYRNDVVHQAAISAGREATYLRMESALGGPGFGTPRAVQAFATPISLSAAVAELGSAPAPVAHTAAPPAPVVPSPTSADKPRVTEAGKPAASPAAPVSLTSLVAEQVSGPKSKADHPAPVSARPAARTKDSPPSRGLGLKGSSNGYDPLNGKL